MTDHLVDANKKVALSDDDVIKMAREAGFTDSNQHSQIIVRHSNGSWVSVADRLDLFAELVAAHEREACAKTCESIASNPSSLWSEDGCWAHAAEACAAEIRGRS